MKLIILPKAKKQLKKLPKSDQAKITRKLTYLEAGFIIGKQLHAEYEAYSTVRAWPYRILYTMQDNNTILIHAVKHRQGSYK